LNLPENFSLAAEAKLRTALIPGASGASTVGAAAAGLTRIQEMGCPLDFQHLEFSGRQDAMASDHGV